MARGEISEVIDHILFSVQAAGTTRVLAKTLWIHLESNL